MSDRERACEGGQTLSDGQFEECLVCDTRVAWDLVSHRFWGFKSSCPQKRQVGSGTDAPSAERAQATSRSEAP